MIRRAIIAIAISMGSGCTSPTPITTAPPGLLVTPTAIWLPDDASEETPVCARLFQPNSLYRWKCVRLRSVLVLIDGMATAN